jgi:hypothetical protein
MNIPLRIVFYLIKLIKNFSLEIIWEIDNFKLELEILLWMIKKVNVRKWRYTLQYEVVIESFSKD